MFVCVCVCELPLIFTSYVPGILFRPSLSTAQKTPAHASLESLLATGHRLLDVRTQGEFSNNSATSAPTLPLASLPSLMESLDKLVCVPVEY